MTDLASLPERAMGRYTRLLLAHRLWFLAAALALLAAAAAGIPRVTFDNTPDSFFLQGDRTLVVYDRFKQLFASDEYSLIVLDAPVRWTAGFVEQMRDLQRALERLPHVRRVTAITNVRHIAGDAEAITVGDFLPPGLDGATLDRKRAIAVSHPYYRDLYLSADGRYLGIVVETEIIVANIDYKVELTRQIRGLLAQEPYRTWNPRAVGAPILDAEVREIVSRESGLFGVLAFALIGAGFLFVFRSLLGIALPMAVALCSITASFGIMGWLGAPVGLLTPIIPSFLVSVGVSTCVFLMTHLYSAVNRGLGVRPAIVEAMQVAGPPGIMAGLTTATALLAFTSSRIAPVQQVGIVMGLALLVALVMTLVFLPAAFSLYRTLPNSDRRNRLIQGRVRCLDAVCDVVLRRPGAILLGFAVLLALAGIGVARLDSGYYYLGNFKRSTPIRQDYEAVDSAIRASSAIEVMVRGAAADAFKEPSMLRALAALEDHIGTYGQVPTKTYSVADVIKEINQALHEGDASFYRLPDSRSAVAQGLLLFESSGSDELTRVVSPDYRTARLTVRVPTLPDSAYHPLVHGIERFAATAFAGQGAEVTVTGLVPLWMTISGYLSQSQMSSLMISASVVTMVMMALFRSVVLGLLMSAANIAVVAVVLGVMGGLSVSLDPYTILVAAIALGILDDDTLHFVKHVQHEYERGGDLAEAIRSAFRSAGQAMFYTSAVLVAGFAIYTLSTVASLTKFGLLVGLTLMLGLCMEYLITPAVLLVLNRFGLLQSPSAVRSMPQTEP